MNKFLTHLMVAILVVAFCASSAFGAAPMQNDPVMAVVAADGTVSIIDLNDGSEAVIQFGDPDDGITGNRGDSGETLTGSSLPGFVGGASDAVSVDGDLWLQLYELYLQFLACP